MGACCSCTDAYGSPNQNEAAKASVHSGNSPTQSTNGIVSGAMGSVGSNNRAFVYPKISALPKRTHLDSPCGSGHGRKGTGSGTQCSEATANAALELKINTLFDRYASKFHTDLMLSESILKFCNDLGITTNDWLLLAFAWKLRAAQMGRITREEFLFGCKKLRVESMKSIQGVLPTLAAELKNAAAFKDFYKWAYQFALDGEIGQKILSLDMAIQLWTLVFSARPLKPQTLDRWLKFLQKSHSSIPGITKDTWCMLFVFLESVGDNFEGYSADEAWPSLIDDFVEAETASQIEGVGLNQLKQLKTSASPRKSPLPPLSNSTTEVLQELE